MVKSTRKKYLAVILSLAMMVSLLPALALPALAAGDVWDGTSVDTQWYTEHSADTSFTIDTAAKLAGLASITNAGTDTFIGDTITLGADIDLNGKEWTPIGTDTYKFGGTFKGTDHTVTLNISNTGKANVGVFGYIGSDGTVQNLVISCNVNNSCAGDVYIGSVAAWNYGTIASCSATGNLTGVATAATGTQNSGIYVGGISAINYAGIISNCASKCSLSSSGIYGTVSTETNQPNAYLGGIAAMSYTGSIESCSAECTVSGNASAKDCSSKGQINIGGLVGGSRGDGAKSNIIKNCTASCTTTGTISAESSSMTPYAFIGGLVGFCGSASSIESCSSSGSVAGTATATSTAITRAYVGGLVGMNQLLSTIKDSSSTCSAEGTSSSGGTKAYTYVGGLAGYNFQSSIQNSHASGNVSGIGISLSIGGIVGQNRIGSTVTDSTITGCCATGSISGNGTGSTYSGGLAGYNNGTVGECYATGTVSNNGASTPYACFGGLAGYSSGRVENCYSRGSVNGSATDELYLGGLLGCNYGITNTSYSTGGVSGSGSGINCIGGLAGYNDTSATITAGYFDNQTSGQTTGVGYNNNTASGAVSVTGLTTAEMTGTDTENKMQLDYSSKWKTQASSNGYIYYPQLKWASGFDSVAVAVYYPGNFSSPITSPGSTILVNGETQTAGTAATTTDANGKSTTTVTVDTQKLEKILDTATSGATVTIPVTGGADTASGVLTGDLVKSMEKKDATLVIKTDSASYALPASEIDIDKVSVQLGTSVTLSDIKVSVSIAEPSASMTQVVASATEKGQMDIVVPAVDFTISCSYNGKTVDVNSFNTYVERLIEIPGSIDPTKITTGVVVKPDGTTYHVPTQVIQKDGKYYAKISSLTNSTYTVVWHPLEFADVSNHWAKSAINDMGSRMVVTGDDSGKYNPDNYITRAEFAAIAVKALGLAPGSGEKSFSDVSSSAWYCGYIETATAYGVVKGYSASSFCPNDFITREQAMTMLTRAMSITGLEVSLTESDIITLIGAFKDGTAVSSYTKGSIAACLKTGIVTGTGSSAIAPKDNVTRAEVAVMLERLLKKSGLI